MIDTAGDQQRLDQYNRAIDMHCHGLLSAPTIVSLCRKRVTFWSCGCWRFRLSLMGRRSKNRNLWLGLYNTDREQPRAYFFFLTLEAIFALHPYGKSLGLGAIIVEQ